MFEALRRRLRSPAAMATRWIVVDVESTGLDPRRDRLLSIAAVAVHLLPGGPRIVLADSFETVLRGGTPDDADGAEVDKANVLVHGIGVGARHAGADAVAALQAFEAYADGAPVVAYHAAFDRTLIDAALRRQGVASRHGPWLDLAALGPVLRSDVRGQSLDDWLTAFGIRCLARHRAAADALATAELLLCLWPLARRAHGAEPDFAAVQRLAAARRWLGG